MLHCSFVGKCKLWWAGVCFHEKTQWSEFFAVRSSGRLYDPTAWSVRCRSGTLVNHSKRGCFCLSFRWIWNKLDIKFIYRKTNIYSYIVSLVNKCAWSLNFLAKYRFFLINAVPLWSYICIPVLIHFVICHNFILSYFETIEHNTYVSYFWSNVSDSLVFSSSSETTYTHCLKSLKELSPP